MPTITPANLTAPISTVQPTQPAQDSRRAAAIAQIEAGKSGNPLQTPSNIVQDAPGSTIEGKPTPSPSQETGTQQKPIESKLDPSQKDDVDARIAMIARKERQAWQQVKQVKAEKAALEAAQAGKFTKEELIAQLTPDEIGSLYLSKSAPVDPSIQALKAEIQELRAGQVKQASDVELAQKAAYDQAVKQIDTEARSLVNASDAYEVTRSQGATGAITKLIELTYQEEGVLMDVTTAAAQVEAHLEAEAVKLFSQSTKLKAKLTPTQQATSAEAGNTKQQSHPQTQRTNTLTHGLVQASSKPLDRRERAIAAWNANKR